MHLAILAKAAIAGFAKTRLIPLLGEHGAANLQAWLLERTLITAHNALDQHYISSINLWCTPEIGHPSLNALAERFPVQRLLQPEGDLGTRLLAALSHEHDDEGTLIIGTDCAVLTAEHLRRAATALHTHEVVMIPAEDGGYVLIGCRVPHAELFHDIDWSTAKVAEQTRAHCRAYCRTFGWQWHEDAPLWDVDTAEDFVRLANAYPSAPLPKPLSTLP